IEAEAAATKASNEQYRITTDADRTRPTFSNSEILETTARATTVENDPSAYLAGESMGGSSGSCVPLPPGSGSRSEEHTSELQSLMRISYAVFCLKKKNTQ